ncbi:MAG: hypothetical protein GY940_25935 [bacterium]|nr:hypothetical protein [bacterium]
MFDSLKTALSQLSPPVDVYRVDELFTSSAIISDILTGILKADFIIVDLTSQNSNVVYELGLCHATKDDVIIIVQDQNDVPVNLKYLRNFQYSQTDSGLKTLGERICEAVRGIPEMRLIRKMRLLDKTLSPLKDFNNMCSMKIQNWFSKHFDIMHSTTNWPELKKNDTDVHTGLFPKLTPILSPFKKGGLYTLDENGIIISSFPINIVGQDYSHREYFKLCKELKKPVVSNSFDSANRDKKILVVAVPRYDEHNKFIGILDGVIDIEDSDMKDILGEMARTPGAQPNIKSFVIDEEYTVVGSNKEELMGTSMGGNALLQKLEQNMGETEDESDCTLENSIGTMLRIKDTPFRIITTTDT